MFINNKIVATLILGALWGVPNAVMANHAQCTDVHAAAFLDEPAELSALLYHGVDLNCRDALRQTPLITATDGASLDIVKMLLVQGAKINARDEIGQTALAMAREKLIFFDFKGGQRYRDLYREMIDLLEKAGATE